MTSDPPDSSFERSFAPSGVEALTLSAAGADVDLRGGSDTIRIRIDHLPERDRQRSVRHVEKTVRVEVASLSLIEQLRHRSGVRPRVTVEVPGQLPVDATISGGSLKASGLHERSTLESRGGAVEASDLAGRCEIRLLGGSGSVTDCSFGKLHLHATGAAVRIRDTTAGEGRLYAASGRLEVDAWPGIHVECHGAELQSRPVAEVGARLVGCAEQPE